LGSKSIAKLERKSLLFKYSRNLNCLILSQRLQKK
jgi:hypothetical protein